jgi:hypothetical protein
MTVQTIKPYLLHPKEWKLGVCLLLLLGGAYLHVRTSVPDGTTTTQDLGLFSSLGKSSSTAALFPLGESSTAADVRRLISNNYCQADLSLMCANPAETQHIFCAQAFADTPLWRSLGLTSRPFQKSQNCTLERLAASAPGILHITQGEKTKFKNDETVGIR